MKPIPVLPAEIALEVIYYTLSQYFWDHFTKIDEHSHKAVQVQSQINASFRLPIRLKHWDATRVLSQINQIFRAQTLRVLARSFGIELKEDGR